MPTPPAAFSPFTTTKSGWWRSRNEGSSPASVRRPMPPPTSATNRSFTAGDSAKLTRMESGAAQADPRTDAVATPVLDARELVKRYGAREALRGVSISAERGELLAVIGPNGAG